MTKMAAMPIYGKNRKNLILCNQKADDLESWYASLGARVLPSLLKWWPWVALDLIYGKVKFGPWSFCIGEKGKTMNFQETIVVYDLKLATDELSHKKFLLTSKLCPLGAVWPPGPGLYTCIKKNCTKSDLKDISFKLATSD